MSGNVNQSLKPFYLITAMHVYFRVSDACQTSDDCRIYATEVEILNVMAANT